VVHKVLHDIRCDMIHVQLRCYLYGASTGRSHCGVELPLRGLATELVHSFQFSLCSINHEE
jgi:hypothetical protein